MEDYEYLWSTLRDSYPCWGILEREGVEVERIYTTYREMVAESDSDADFYSAIYSALYLLGTNGHLSIIEPEAYFSDYLPAAGQYRREGKTHWAEVLDNALRVSDPPGPGPSRQWDGHGVLHPRLRR